jgi:PAS domain S-box-containing protein
MNALALAVADPADPRELLRLAHRCARQVSFSWTPGDDRLRFGDEVTEFLSPGLLEDVRTGADLQARVDPGDRQRLKDALVRALKGVARNGAAGGSIHEALIRVRSSGAHWHWIAMRGHVTATDARGRGTRLSGVLVDETERETERREAVRMRDLYAMLSAINRAIGASDDRQALLTQLCEVAVVHGRFALAWVGVSDALTGRVSAYAQASEAALAVSPPDVPVRADALRLEKLTHSVMQAGVPRTYNDLADLRENHEWLAPALAAGFRSVGCFPLYEQGEAIGGLLLYSRESQHFHQGMTALLQDMGSDVSNALGHLLIKRQQTETHRQLHEAHRQFQTAMRASLDGMLVVGWDGGIVEMNAAARSLLGCDAETSQPLDASVSGARNLFTTFTPARFRAARKVQVRRLLNPDAAAPGARRRIESFLCQRDGLEIPVELVLTPLEAGEDGLLMVTMRDLTAVRDQRDQLISAARRFEQLFEHSPDGILVHVDGLIVLVNGKLRKMLGVDDGAHLLGTDFSRWIA